MTVYQPIAERKVKLPVKPGVPTGPRVYVTNKEYNQYIRPLFWYRWGLKFFNRDLYLKDGELCAGAFNSPYLKRDMHFIGAENTKWFMSRLSRICRASGVSKDLVAVHLLTILSKSLFCASVK